jgi:Tol biopolymer transport system component
MKDLIVEWPSADQISIRTRPSGLAQSVLYTINPSTSDFQKVLSDIYGLTVLWSPSGEKILFSETDNNGHNLKLKVANKDGQIVKELDITTWPEKCVWSQDERIIFCAVPRGLPTTAIWPDDYYKGLFSTVDDFYKINLETNQKTLLVETEQTKTGYDASQLILSPQEDYLIFVNKKDGLLYSLRL